MAVRKDPRNGRWRYQARVWTPDGRRVRISGTPSVNTKKAAEHAERTRIMQIENPSLAPAAPVEPAKEVPTVGEYIETYLSANGSKGKPSHWVGAARILRRDVEPILGHLRLDEVTQEHVDAFAAAQTCGVKTTNNKLSALSAMLRYAERCRLISMPDCRFWLADAAPRSGEICNVPDAHVDAILEAAGDARHRAAILLGRDAGLRAGEIRGLQWGDVDELRDEITVRRSFDPHGNLTAPKSGRARAVPMSEALRAELRDLTRRGLWVVPRLDGEPLSYSGLAEPIVALYERAGVPTPAQPIHGLRHSFCTALADSGAAPQTIKDLAGHAALATTMRYLHADDAARRAAIAGAFGAGKHAANSAARSKRKARKPQGSPGDK